jgi:hypothetical protein
MDEQLAKMFRPGTLAPRYEQRSGTVEWYMEGDPRLRLSAGQSLALVPVIRGEPINAIARRCRTSPNRVRRWLKSPIFRRAVAAEIAKPTEGRFRLSITLRGVQEANTLRRERAAAKELEARDE